MTEKEQNIDEMLSRMMGHMEKGLKKDIEETKGLPEGPKPKPSKDAMYNPFKDEVLGDD
jgi:hypothetical protein